MMHIPIPDDLESMVKSAIRRQNKRMKRKAALGTFAGSVVALALVFTAVVNFSPASANAMAKVPGLKSLVKLATFTKLTYDDGSRKAEVNVPQIDGLEDGDLAAVLNQQYLERNTQLFQEFVEGYPQDRWSPLFIETNFNVIPSREGIFVVENIVTEIGASAKESVRYDNIDLENQMVITLPSLFKDDSYIGVISESIKEQMHQQQDEGEGMVYFIKGEAFEDEGFDQIDAEQIFYIDADSKLVIVFDEYEVAPGFMGIVRFSVPTETIQDVLVSNAYIK